MNKQKHTIDAVFTLVLFLLFAITALFVTASGASAYRNTADTMTERFDRSTCISYITAKVRGNNEKGKITVEDFGGNSALCIREVFGETGYITYIYCSDGGVRELFCQEGLGLGAESGALIADADGLKFKLENSLITAELTDISGKATTFYISL